MGAAATKIVVLDHLLEPISPGTVIKLAGRVLEKPDRFHINLLAENGDTVLQISVRFDDKCVVLNSCRGRYWETEERVISLPIQRGTIFEAIIIVDEIGYKVDFNNQCVAHFKHRMLCSCVKRLQVDGCVAIQRFEQKSTLGASVTGRRKGIQAT